MTQVSSKLSVAGTDDPVVQSNFIPRLAGAFLQVSRTDFNTAITAERTRIVNNTVGIYATGQRIEILGEVGYRVWTVGASAALSNANKVVIRPGLELTLAGDSNTVTARVGNPGSGIGANGDVSVDWAGNAIYTKSGGSWAITTPAIYAAASAPTAYDPPTDDPNNLPVVFSRTDNTAVLTNAISKVFTAGTYHYNVNMNAAGLVTSISAWGAGASGPVLGY